MRHSARSWWLDEAGPPVAPHPPLAGDVDADVVIVGGGYTGLWCAWHLRGARVVVLESGVCGHGPSGRNGGFAENLWLSLPRLRERFGDAGALAIGHASDASLDAIEAWCEEQGVDAWFHRAGQLVTSTAPAHDDVGVEAVRAARELGVPESVVGLDADAVRARCDAPAFRRGVLMPRAATVQPARLALGLRASTGDVSSGGGATTIYEHSPARRVVDRGGAGVEVRTDHGRVRARHAVLATGGALASFPPLRGRFTVASSHIVLTEPVPDVLEAYGWTGGECITDGRALLHYFRTTRDGRIAFGWAGGRLAVGARTGGRIEVDPAVIDAVRRDLVSTFPLLAGRRFTHAWGGPIDIAPARHAHVGTLAGGRVHYAAGYTGNGVGPSQLLGRILASLALDRRDELTRLPIVDPPPDRRVPPEPLRWIGGSVVLAALRRKERAEERGATADPLTAFVTDLPRRLGVTVGR